MSVGRDVSPLLLLGPPGAQTRALRQEQVGSRWTRVSGRGKNVRTDGRDDLVGEVGWTVHTCLSGPRVPVFWTVTGQGPGR